MPPVRRINSIERPELKYELLVEIDPRRGLLDKLPIW